jgi:hypothetical protein
MAGKSAGGGFTRRLDHKEQREQQRRKPLVQPLWRVARLVKR